MVRTDPPELQLAFGTANHCAYFAAGQCRSCTLIPVAYGEQISSKEQRCRELLPHVSESVWLPPSVSATVGFRNRAKLVVGGEPGAVTLGILDAEGNGIDLRECVIHSPAIISAIPKIAAFLNATGLPPYNIRSRKGELKYVHITEAPATAGSPGSGNGEPDLMIRFVGRSQRTRDVLKSRVSALRERIPHAQVITVNLLPEHRAVLEGEREELLYGSTLAMQMGAVTLHLRPQSFFQTNTRVATELYAQVREWITQLAPASLWDLYCGVGGFALHCAQPGTRVTGVELSEAAIHSAQRSAAEMNAQATFHAADATAFALAATPSEHPDALVVNPPRRGIGESLAKWIESSEITSVVYSSCNPESLATDLKLMPSYGVIQARLFDMFPHTNHLEVAVLLKRAESTASQR